MASLIENMSSWMLTAIKQRTFGAGRALKDLLLFFLIIFYLPSAEEMAKEIRIYYNRAGEMRRVQRKLLPISRHRRIEDEINLRRASRRVLLLKLCNLRRVSVSGGFFFCVNGAQTDGKTWRKMPDRNEGWLLRW